jgi:hypothetical protein
MNKPDNVAFTSLFKEACSKCFGHPLEATLTETESRLFCNMVLEQTGLVIGFKSVKNYSAYVLGEGKEENPSVATLDTLARYVMDAPYTDEVERKKQEGHYPYWFKYKEQVLKSQTQPLPDKKPGKAWLAMGTAAILLLVIGAWLRYHQQSESFTDDFHSLKKGWFVLQQDPVWWPKHDAQPGVLTLYTLKGDNWPDPLHPQGIPDLLTREVSADNFTVEAHMQQFVPQQNWQQAGILLMEDTLFKGKTIRISLGYNDYTGGYPSSRQIIIQAVTSLGEQFSKPEEIAHTTLFYADSLRTNPALLHNLDYSALRMEKRGARIRLLYAGGAMENTAFKEIVSTQFDIKPRYVGLFACKGFVDSTENMPVQFTFFKIDEEGI